MFGDKNQQVETLCEVFELDKNRYKFVLIKRNRWYDAESGDCTSFSSAVKSVLEFKNEKEMKNFHKKALKLFSKFINRHKEFQMIDDYEEYISHSEKYKSDFQRKLDNLYNNRNKLIHLF
jgi:glutamate synthase domain-containing protein 2